jgi:hypothetical protein
MGRILDTLKRRDAAGNGTPHRHDASQVLPFAAAAPEADDWSLGSGDIPFIEVPATPSQGVVQQAPAAAPSAVVPATPIKAPAARLAGTFTPVVSAVEGTGDSTEDREAYQPACTALWTFLNTEAIRSALLLPLHRPVAPAGLIKVIEGLRRAGCRNPLVIETALQSPSLVEALGGVATPGWMDLLAGMKARQVVHLSSLEGVRVIGPGHRLALPAAEMFQRTPAIVAELSRRHALTLLLAEPWTAERLPTLLVHGVDGTILISSAAADHALTPPRATDALQVQGVRVLGSLVLPSAD